MSLKLTEKAFLVKAGYYYCVGDCAWRKFAHEGTTNMNLTELYQKALGFHFLTLEEGVFLFKNAPLTELMFVADELRKKQVPHGKVTWQIDRNVNTTNVCIANCKFCNFYRIPGHPEAYITDMPVYRK